MNQQLITVVGGYDVVRDVLAGDRDAPPTDPGEALRLREAEEAERRAAKAASRRDRKQQAGSPKAKQTPKPTGGDATKRTVKRKSTKRDGSPKVRRPGTIETEIEQLDTRKAEVDALMLDPDVYTDAAKSATLLEEHAKLDRELVARWAELERAVEVHGG
jgi:FtsZ-interacting cell division protein YlmF